MGPGSSALLQLPRVSSTRTSRSSSSSSERLLRSGSGLGVDDPNNGVDGIAAERRPRRPYTANLHAQYTGHMHIKGRMPASVIDRKRHRHQVEPPQPKANLKIHVNAFLYLSRVVQDVCLQLQQVGRPSSQSSLMVGDIPHLKQQRVLVTWGPGSTKMILMQPKHHKSPSV